MEGAISTALGLKVHFSEKFVDLTVHGFGFLGVRRAVRDTGGSGVQKCGVLAVDSIVGRINFLGKKSHMRDENFTFVRVDMLRSGERERERKPVRTADAENEWDTKLGANEVIISI